VVSSASAEDIHAAYKRLARRAHPDAGGDATQMAAINEAYRVLSDQGRRARYDARERGPVVTSVPTPAQAVVADPDDEADEDFMPMAAWQRRLPMWAILVLGSLFTVFLFTAYATSGRGTTTTTLPAVDGELAVGSCVHEAAGGFVEEIGCGGRRDGVVMALVRVGERCPAGTEGMSRRDADGHACITRN
jgi:DnaJ domain